MTVSQLIAQLETMPRDAVVSIALMDTNGNGLGECSVDSVRDDTEEFSVVTITAEVN